MSPPPLRTFDVFINANNPQIREAQFPHNYFTNLNEFDISVMVEVVRFYNGLMSEIDFVFDIPDNFDTEPFFDAADDDHRAEVLNYFERFINHIQVKYANTDTSTRPGDVIFDNAREHFDRLHMRLFNDIDQIRLWRGLIV